jgi:hypothetical protein
MRSHIQLLATYKATEWIKNYCSQITDQEVRERVTLKTMYVIPALAVEKHKHS